MVTEADLILADGRTLHIYDTGRGSADSEPLAVYWHHGTPHLGSPPEPFFLAAAQLGLRWISHDRPGYGRSSPSPGRDVASVAADVAAVADAVGVGKFAVMGHSGGGPHALGCAARLPERVLGVVTAAGPAPFEAVGLDWFTGMIDSGAAELRAAVTGRETLEKLLRGAAYNPEMFTAADHEALATEWAWLGEIAEAAVESGIGPVVDDDLAYVRPWGFELAEVRARVLVLHGEQDRVIPAAHGRWLAAHLPLAELWSRPDDGHVSVLAAAEAALEWLAGTSAHSLNSAV